MSLPLAVDVAGRPKTVWFAPRACVIERGDRREVVIGGTLVGSYGAKDFAQRNLLAVGLAQDPKVHLGELARGLGLSPEGLRQLRRLHEQEGIGPLLARRQGGGESRVPATVGRKLERLFESGASVSEAFEAVRKHGLSRSTVGRVRQAWAARGAPLATSPSVSAAVAGPAEPPKDVEKAEPTQALVAEEQEEKLTTRSPQSAPMVQHAGSWLLVASVHALGLHFSAAKSAGERVSKTALRIALDAVVVALGLGERAVEGVRRVATLTAGVLLLSARAPSASWTRRVLGRFAKDNGGAAFHLSMAREYVEMANEAAAREGPAFYVDNHMRPYTGKETVRRGWRMQDKRVRPGASDYYVHDDDGRPMGRVTAPHHGALTDFISPIATLLRLALPEENILLAFDRAGAFPAQMAELRDANFEFVTYERRPYALLAESDFTEELLIDGERLRWCESRKNLGAGRGRVRRICVRTEDGHQVNLLAVSRRPARRLIELMRGRWSQENGFKHGNERWGINQLDGRTVLPYPEDTVIPNPARRRLDEALRIQRAREGLLRTELARLDAGDERRGQVEADIAEAIAEQSRLEALRPTTPKHAPLKDTELAGKLVHHEQEYKLVIDTIRIACANAESELAAMLAPHLPRGAEAKKALANLFAAPGRVQVGAKAITVTLHPAGTGSELVAFDAFVRQLNGYRLCLPGDQERRALRFAVAQVR